MKLYYSAVCYGLLMAGREACRLKESRSILISRHRLYPRRAKFEQQIKRRHTISDMVILF
jgi:hypothetical protein